MNGRELSHRIYLDSQKEPFPLNVFTLTYEENTNPLVFSGSLENLGAYVELFLYFCSCSSS